MSEEYKCAICGGKATVHITKIIDNQKLKIHLCENCSKKTDFDLASLFSPDTMDALSSTKKKSTSASKEEGVCKTCGQQYSSFEKNSRVSCPDCYATFRSKFDDVMMQMHQSTTHVGKVLKTPKSKTKKTVNVKNYESLEDLNDQLNMAIAQERYEDAAVLRDKIQQCKGA